jgi:hypothetical protein
MRARVVGWLAVALWVPALGAQSATRSSGSGFVAGLGFHGASIRVDEDDRERESGSGGQLQIGYGFTPRFALFLEGASASMTASGVDANDYVLIHADIGMRYSFTNPAKAWIPFVGVAATGRSMRDADEDFEVTGSAITIGAGIHYFFKPKWAFTTSLRVSAGEFDTARAGSFSLSGLELDATSTRFGLGVTWFPKG